MVDRENVSKTRLEVTNDDQNDVDENRQQHDDEPKAER